MEKKYEYMMSNSSQSFSAVFIPGVKMRNTKWYKLAYNATTLNIQADSAG